MIVSCIVVYLFSSTTITETVSKTEYDHIVIYAEVHCVIMEIEWCADFVFLSFPDAPINRKHIVQRNNKPVFEELLIDCKVSHVKSALSKTLNSRNTRQ